MNNTDCSKVFSCVAQNIQQVDITPDIAVSRWNVDRSQVRYQQDKRHTLSMYIKGGQSSYRTDQPIIKGAPGRIILMPQGHDSNWNINDEIEFAHLYFSDNVLKYFAASTFDCDIRYIELQDLTYQDDIVLQKLFIEHFSFCESNTNKYTLFVEQSLDKILYHIISYYNGFNIKNAKISSGLSPFHIKHLKIKIDRWIGDKISIEKLAHSVNLSSFHFAHMFKLSFGISPAQYILHRRIQKVKKYLTTSLSLAEISARVGFCQQSHMTQHFKKLTGTTPRKYRQYFI